MTIDLEEGRRLMAAATKGPEGYLKGLDWVQEGCLANGEFVALADDYGVIEEPVELAYAAWAVNNAAALMEEVDRLSNWDQCCGEWKREIIVERDALRIRAENAEVEVELLQVRLKTYDDNCTCWDRFDV